jgi:pimeloyl-ACP methyl ester carboxylesterase
MIPSRPTATNGPATLAVGAPAGFARDRDRWTMTRALLLLSVALATLVACSSPRIVSQTPDMPQLEAITVQDPVFSRPLRVYRGGNPNGPTVVLLHGIGEEASHVWSALVPELVDEYHVLAFDLPGFGGSPGGNEAYTPKNYARVLEHVVAEFAETPFYLAGHSLGGSVALEFVGRNPDQVAHLFLVSVPGILHEGAFTTYLISENTNDGQDAGLSERVTARLLRKFIRKTPNTDGIMDSAFLRDLVLSGSPRRIAGFGVAITDFSEILADLRTPTSIFWGREDQVAPPRTGHLLAALAPGHDLTLFDDTGHVPMKDWPGVFNQRFIERLRHGNPDPSPWPAAARSPGTRTASCSDHHDGMTIEGRYRSIVIEDCTNVTLERVTARRIEIHRSRVTLRDPYIVGEEAGVVMTHSDVMLTAGRIAADTPIEMNSTFLDIAGTTLLGRNALIRAIGHEANEITASVVRGATRDLGLKLHGIYALAPGQTL